MYRDDVEARAPRRSQAGRGEKTALFFVLLVIGGALGYAAFRAAVGTDQTGIARGDVQVVSNGEEVDLVAHAVAGKYTIYDFYADWCPPCRVLNTELTALAAQHDNLAIRKIDIVDWTSPVVAQHGVVALPHLVIYGPDGEWVAAGDDAFAVVADVFSTSL